MRRAAGLCLYCGKPLEPGSTKQQHEECLARHRRYAANMRRSTKYNLKEFVRYMTRVAIACGLIELKGVCQHPGCDRKDRLQVHHRTYTKPDSFYNVVEYCPEHHAEADRLDGSKKDGFKKLGPGQLLALLVEMSRVMGAAAK